MNWLLQINTRQLFRPFGYSSVMSSASWCVLLLYAFCDKTVLKRFQFGWQFQYFSGPSSHNQAYVAVIAFQNFSLVRASNKLESNRSSQHSENATLAMLNLTVIAHMLLWAQQSGLPIFHLSLILHSTSPCTLSQSHWTNIHPIRHLGLCITQQINPCSSDTSHKILDQELTKIANEYGVNTTCNEWRLSTISRRRQTNLLEKAGMGSR